MIMLSWPSHATWCNALVPTHGYTTSRHLCPHVYHPPDRHADPCCANSRCAHPTHRHLVLAIQHSDPGVTDLELIQGPFLAKRIESNIAGGVSHGLLGDFRWMLWSATLATIVGAPLIPTFQRFFSRAVLHFQVNRSVPRLLLSNSSPSRPQRKSA